MNQSQVGRGDPGRTKLFALRVSETRTISTRSQTFFTHAYAKLSLLEYILIKMSSRLRIVTRVEGGRLISCRMQYRF